MDQNSGNGTDKRNWRERLGIGKPGAPTDMPKLSDDFKAPPVAPRPATPAPTTAVRPGTAKPAPHVPVKAAPMAPRPAAKPAAPAATPAAAVSAAKPAAPRVAPVAPDALAAKLKDQRDAAERLAVQRVQAAKQRAEAQVQTGATPGAKPKFSFADDAKAESSASAAAATQRPATAAPLPGTKPAMPPPGYVPQTPQGYQPQIQPARPPLGSNPGYVPPGYQQGGSAYAPQPPFPPQYQAPFGNQAFGQQTPQYRPVDPATGYAPPSGYSPAARPAFPTTPQVPNPRLANPPSRAPLSGDRPRNPQLSAPRMPMGPALGADPDSDDVFEAPHPRTPRRATANEYQQAYRDELGYDEELPRSRGLGMILGMLLLGLLVAIGVIYGYSHFVKGSKTAAGGGVPVVAAPAGATKVTPDTNAASADQAGKKQIYDRIEGDHEVPGTPMKSNEEAPTPPAGTGASQPMQQNGAAQPATGGGDGTPLPLPPPPGGGTGQQGALSPDGKTDMANITPAAEPASAANSSAAGSTQVTESQSALPVPTAPAGSAKAVTPLAQESAAAAAPPVPGTPKGTEPAAPKEEVVAETAKPATADKAATAKPKADAMKKLVLGNSALPKNLGAKPVVLVPPSTQTTADAASTPVLQVTPPTQPAAVGGGGLYGDAPVATAQPSAPLKVATAKPAVVAPAPVLPAATGAYVVQLSSFNTKAEAQAEYARLSAKHGAIITRYAPIIETGTIAGSTRYKLDLGPMASNDAASGVCSALISAGERDCKVGRQ